MIQFIILQYIDFVLFRLDNVLLRDMIQFIILQYIDFILFRLDNVLLRDMIQFIILQYIDFILFRLDNVLLRDMIQFIILQYIDFILFRLDNVLLRDMIQFIILQYIDFILFRLDNVLLKACSTSNCQNGITMFCLDCRKFMCKICDHEHHSQPSTHAKSSIVMDKDDSLRAVCDIHKTVCKFMCEKSCDNKLICIYCTKRNHADHGFKTSDFEVKKIKDILELEIQKMQTISQIGSIAQQGIIESEKRFEQAIKLRKFKCLSEYISLLNSEEKLLYEQFNQLTSDHKKQYNISESADRLKELLKRTDVEFGLLKEHILDNLVQHRGSNTVLRHTTSLSSNNFMSGHPLGELIRESVGEVAVHELKDASCFIFNIPEIHEEDSTSILLQQLKDLFREG